ncbi:hypothetical protein MC885_007993 [Smutsia gigantea]|nr:hypothetical protein MC885_007993 [Smutsia gigantea]
MGPKRVPYGDDHFELIAGYLPQNIPLEIIRYLAEEKDFLPWHAASRALYPLDKLLDRMEKYNVFNGTAQRSDNAGVQFWQQALSPTGIHAYFRLDFQQQEQYSFGKLGISLPPQPNNDSNKNNEEEECHHHTIPLNVRDIVYCTGVSLLDEDVWEFIWMKFHSTTAVSEKKILLEALTCSDDRNLLNRLLNLSLNSEVVLDQDAIDVIIHVARNPHGRDLAWKFFRDKWKILNTRYGEALFMNSKLISGVTEFLNTEGELKELKNFMKSYDGVAAASFSRAVETVEANVRWKMLYQEELFQWLGKVLRH